MAQYVIVNGQHVEISSIIRAEDLGTTIKLNCANDIRRETSDATEMGTLRSLISSLLFIRCANGISFAPEQIEQVASTGSPRCLSIIDTSGNAWLIEEASDITEFETAVTNARWTPP